MPVNITLSGEGISFEREISERTALRVMEVSMNDGEIGEQPPQEAAGETSEEASGRFTDLPNDFFDRLTDRQEAYVRVLLDADDWVTNEDIRTRMEEEYGLSTGGPQGISGIRSGITRKYGDEFDLDEQHWRGNQNEYRLNPDHIEELRENLD